MVLQYLKFQTSIILLLYLFSVNIIYSQIPQISGDLRSEIIDISNNMPGSGSNGFAKPSFSTRSQWRMLTSLLLDDDYEAADSLIQIDFPFYQLIEYTDIGFENKTYFLLREKTPITRGWGTFIINPNYDREIVIEVPHPRFDSNTDRQGADVFRRTGSHFLIMTGTHRCANSEESPCSGTTGACGGSAPFRVSDAAHFDEAIFQTTHETIAAKYPQGYSINLHGHGRSNCEDFFLSNGHSTDSKQILFDLENNLLAEGGVSVGIAGDGVSTCPLIGSTNVQGRFTNGSSNPCEQAVSSTTGHFIHVEQSRRIRESITETLKLINAINANIQPLTAIEPVEITIPQTFELRAYPNPFNPATTIEYSLPQPAHVVLKIYNSLGAEVQTLVNKLQNRGTHSHRFDATNLKSGVYYARIQTTVFTQTIRLVLLK